MGITYYMALWVWYGYVWLGRLAGNSAEDFSGVGQPRVFNIYKVWRATVMTRSG